MFPGLWFNYSNEYGLDINQSGGLKELGLMAIKESLNLKVEDIIAVGDGENDISMIEYAGLGIAMGNANDKVKSSADIVAEHISDDGLYNVFKKLQII
jgi:hydroxymethylpyrimidine pyrophosphatase-like HAD family hydrolase